MIATDDVPEGTAPDLYPTRLVWSLQGWPPPGPSAFEWQDAHVTYWAAGKQQSATPGPRQWKRLWQICDEVGVWSWPPKIGDIMVIDGLQYALELQVGSRVVKSSGQAIGSPAGFADKVKRLHKAMQELVRS